MKILFYCRQFHPSVGGLENVAKDLASELSLLGHEIVVVTRVANSGHDNFSFPILRRLSFWTVTKKMRQSEYVIMFNVSLKGLLQQVLSGRPLVIYHHSGLFYPGRRKSVRQLFKKWVADYWAVENIVCSANIGKDYKNAKILLNPYDDTLFQCIAPAARPNKFLFVGRLVSDKGCDVLIKAFQKIAPILPSHSTLTIIGDGKDRSSLEKMVRNHNLEKKIIFKGFLTGEILMQQMNMHEVMIVPSRWEPFGIIVLEGLACGCRMIISNAGGLQDAAGGFARIFESENVDSLAKAMLKELDGVLDNDVDRIKSHLSKHTKKITATDFIKIITNAN